MPASSIGTILNDDGLSISVVGGSAPEGTTTGGVLTFTVSLSGIAKMPVNVDYATSNGTAMSGTDFIGANGTLTFAPGETTKTILVDIVPGSMSEGNETILMTLTNPQPAHVTTLDIAMAYGTIIEDDGAVHLPVNDLRALLLMLLLIGGFGGLALRRR